MGDYSSERATKILDAYGRLSVIHNYLDRTPLEMIPHLGEVVDEAILLIRYIPKNIQSENVKKDMMHLENLILKTLGQENN